MAVKERWVLACAGVAVASVAGTRLLSATAQVISDPLGKTCVATNGETCSATDLAISNGGTASAGTVAVGDSATAGLVAIGVTSASAGCNCLGGEVQLAAAANGSASVCGGTIAGIPTEIAISIFGNASGCAQGVAVSGTGNANALTLAISGTGTATNNGYNGIGAVSGTGYANSNGAPIAVSGIGPASSGGVSVGGGDATASELAISESGSATACGGPYPIALSGGAIQNKPGATGYACPGTLP